MHKAGTTLRALLPLTLMGGVLLASGCNRSWPPPRLKAMNIGGQQDYSLGRTALRGAGYKRLITTFAETHGLVDALDELEADVRAHEPVDERVLEDIAALRADTETFRDEIRYKLDVRRREKWHRVQVGQLWNRYRELNPDGMVLHNTYKRERRVDADEIRDRRTPLTGEMRFSPWGIERWRRQPWESNMYAPGGEPQIEKTPRWKGPWEYPDESGAVPQEHWGPGYGTSGGTYTDTPRAAPQAIPAAPKSEPARQGSYMVPAEPRGEATASEPKRSAPRPATQPTTRPSSGTSDVRVYDPKRDEASEDETREPVIDLIDP